MDGGHQMQIRDSEAFLTDLPGIDGDGDVWLFAAFTHGRVTFLASLFRFRFLRMVLASVLSRRDQKYLLGGFVEGVLFYEEEWEERGGGFLWYNVGI
jgi:hypothetical protein